jgi:hypothetical protein
MLYRVTWEIDIDAESPREAAMQAMQMMPRDLNDPDDGATVFSVHPDQRPKDAVFIDLAEPENED